MARTTRGRGAAAPPTRAISDFARVSKSQPAPSVKIDAAKESLTGKRRGTKRQADVTSAPGSDDTLLRAEPPQTPGPAAKRLRRTPPAPRSSSSSTKKAPATARSTSTETPVRSRQARLEDYAYTSRRAGEQQQQQQQEKEDAAAELVRLHGAFLRTALLHVAHHGRTAPMEVAAVAGQVARNWGRRAVTLDDVRRCVALQGPASPFVVCDYGRGRVCVELKQDNDENDDDNDNNKIDEARLCRQVVENVRAWEDVPLAEVVARDAGVVGAANPLLAKGHRALSELKSGLAEKQRLPAPAPAPPAADGTRPMSVLDRIRAKQLARAAGPAPPSAAELQRRAALERAADVAATIGMLSVAGAQARQAFTMALVADKLRDSLRGRVSREEGVACVRVIADEVAPEWIRVVAVGGRDNVVVQRNRQPVERVLRERVRDLLGLGELRRGG